MKEKIGFTLIEMLIVLAILSIIAAIAYPAYQSHIIKVRRVEAQGELIKAQIQQSSYRIINPSFLSQAATSGLPLNHPHYQFSVEHASTNTYTLKATVKPSSNTQNNDDQECLSLYIDQNNNKTSDGESDNSRCWIN